ncbi:hypothetical protein D3C80_1773380 [compost metagenome]
MGFQASVPGMEQPHMRGLIRVSGSRQEAAKKSMMCSVGEAAGGMPFLPGASAAQIGTVRLLQDGSVVAQGIKCNHQNVVGADNVIHIPHNR